MVVIHIQSLFIYGHYCFTYRLLPPYYALTFKFQLFFYSWIVCFFFKSILSSFMASYFLIILSSLSILFFKHSKHSFYNILCIPIYDVLYFYYLYFYFLFIYYFCLLCHMVPYLCWQVNLEKTNKKKKTSLIF